MGRHRLVTLTGAGGCGKTRLAIEVAGGLASGFRDGACFADLATVSDEGKVGDAVVGALGLAEDPTRADPVARLAGYLDDRAVLCVLDKCEHVLDACAALAEAVVSRGTASRLLATSREPLGVVGEQVYVVPSLDVDTEAVRLFADRASEARAGFTVDDQNRETVAEICRRLDGIPLAIELAAARIPHLSPTQLLERLNDRFDLLIADRRIPRHQTLTATLDWSYDLLDAGEQETLGRLAVFPASFTLEAAEAVVGGAGMIEALASLVARSLVQIVDAGERLRYRLLETVRLYVQGRFMVDEVESCRARHRDWVLDWLESIPLEERLLGDIDHFRSEYANINAALEWSAAHGDVEVVARIAAGTDWVLGVGMLRMGEHVQEGARWCEAAVSARHALSSDLRVQLYVMLCELASRTALGLADWTRIDDWAKSGIDAARGKPSPFHAGALRHRAFASAGKAVETHDDSLARRATEFAEADVAMSQQFSAPWHMYSRLGAGNIYATLALGWPRHVQAVYHHFAAGIAVTPPAPPYLGLHAMLFTQLALHRFLAGDHSEACALAREAHGNIALSPAYGGEAPLILALVLALGSGSDVDVLRAELRAYHHAVQRRDWGSGAAETVALYGGILAAVHEDWELAARLLAAGARSAYRSSATAHLYFHFRDRVRAALGPKLSRELRDEGRAMPLGDALAAALH